MSLEKGLKVFFAIVIACLLALYFYVSRESPETESKNTGAAEATRNLVLRARIALEGSHTRWDVFLYAPPLSENPRGGIILTADSSSGEPLEIRFVFHPSDPDLDRASVIFADAGVVLRNGHCVEDSLPYLCVAVGAQQWTDLWRAIQKAAILKAIVPNASPPAPPMPPQQDTSPAQKVRAISISMFPRVSLCP